MAEDTTNQPAWLADLPEDIRGNATLSSFKGNDWKEVGPALAKSFIDTKAMTGRKAYDLPQQDWPAEKWQEWNKTIGVPDSPEKYPAVDDAMAAKAGMSKEALGVAYKKFHELGMTPRQVKGLLNDWYVGEAARGVDIQEQQSKAQAETDIASLKQEYGDKYHAKMGLLKSFLQKFGSPELVDWAEKSGAGNNPGFVKALVKASEAMLEDSSHGGRAGQFGPASNKQQALLTISELKQNKDFMSQFMGGNKEAVKKWNELYQMAYSNAA